MTRRLVAAALLSALCAPGLAAQSAGGERRRTALRSSAPSNEVVRLDIDADGRPDIVERWWNGRRVRWLDENGDLRADDTRGDTVSDTLQVDKNGDGLYDGPHDQNVRWVDSDGDGRADMQIFVTHSPEWSEGRWDASRSHWMIFIDVERDGVLGRQDWEKFDFDEDNWAYTGAGNWMPDYHGDAVFLKIHRPPQALPDPRLNWENPFAFYDYDADGLSEMAMRWLDPSSAMPPIERGVSALSGRLGEAFVTFDLDNDSARGNETDYDMTLRGAGGPGVPYRSFVHKHPAMRGQAKFDACFLWNNWRRVDELMYMPHERGFDNFFTAGWASLYFVYDEDDDDHRWERVEMYYPFHGFGGPEEEVDLYSTKRWRRGNYANQSPAGEGERPGLMGHPQADSLGDRGEFDRDNSGGGRLYVGAFDRKLHLAGAEWGAWLVDRNAEYHGGWKTPSPKPLAPRVGEVVRYADTDGNGFLDTFEYDYEGDRAVDFKVSLLDYRTPANPHPDAAPLIDTRGEGWRGLHAHFRRAAEQSWREALAVYGAAWRRGLTTPETDALAFASSLGERHEHAYWLKEKVFRLLRARLGEAARAEPARAAEFEKLSKELTRLYYTGLFEEYVRRIGEVPGG